MTIRVFSWAVERNSLQQVYLLCFKLIQIELNWYVIFLFYFIMGNNYILIINDLSLLIWLELLITDTTLNISTHRMKIMDSTSVSREIRNNLIFNLEMYERVLLNYLISKRRELYYYKHFPLNYIKSGMSKNRRVYEKMRRYTHTTPDKGWINIYRKEINKEINLRVDLTSLILKDFHFIRDTRKLLDVQSADTLAFKLLYRNKRYICYKCSFTHPRYPFKYKNFLEIYQLINYATYNFIINNCLS